MKLFGLAEQGYPVQKLRFHPHRRLLASVSSPRAEVCVWTWDDSGAMECLARINRDADSPPALEQDLPRAADLNREVRRRLQELGSVSKGSTREDTPARPAGEDSASPAQDRAGPRVNDVAWHPHGDLLAVAAEGRAIELWEGGCLVKTIGRRPIPGRVRGIPTGIGRPGEALIPLTFMMDIPLAEQGYDALAFSADGRRLVASLRGEDPQGHDPTEVYDVATGALVGSFWRSDTTLALHPEGEILATISSDQMATSIRFGRLIETFESYDAELNAFGDGYARLLFSPAGDAFAIVGHAYYFGVRVYRFPSCQVIFEADCESWEDIRRAYWQRHQTKEPGCPGAGKDDPPSGFLVGLPDSRDRIAFTPDGRHLLVGATRGAVVEVDMSSGQPVRAHQVHDDPVTALDLSPAFPLLASADSEGRIRLWMLDVPRSRVDRDTKPITAEFLETYRPIDIKDPGARLRTTDGKRWYDFETIGEDDLDDEAPPWAQIAKMTSLWGLNDRDLEERARSDPWARHVKSTKANAEGQPEADQPGETGEDRVPG
jgi:WD40 repeat protein